MTLDGVTESLRRLHAQVSIGTLRLHSLVGNIKPIIYTFTFLARMSEGHEGNAGAFLAVCEEISKSRQKISRSSLHQMSGTRSRARRKRGEAEI
jgi:hypothetical protein